MEEIERLQQALEDKDRELRELQASYDDFMESSKELEQELERELENESQKSSDLSLKKQILEEKLEELQHKYSTTTREALHLQDELDKVRIRCRELEIEKRNLEQQNDEALARVRVSEATEADLRYKLERAIEDTVFAQSDIDELRRQREESEARLKKELDDARVQLRAARTGSHPEDAANRRASADAEYYETLEASVEELQVKLQEAEEKNDELNEELLLLEEDLVHAKQQTDNQTDELENVRKECAAVDAQLQEGEKRAEELVAEVTNLTDELISKGQEIRVLQDRTRDYAELQTKGARLEETLKLKAVEVDHVKLQLATLMSELSEQNDKVSELDRLNIKLKSLNDELEAQNLELSSQLESQRSAARRRSTLRIDIGSPSPLPTPRADPVPEVIETPEVDVTPTKGDTEGVTAESVQHGQLEGLVEENRRLIEENATLLDKNESLRNELQLRMERRDQQTAVVISPARIPTLEDLVGDAGSGGSAAQAIRLAVLNGDVMSLAAQIQAMQTKYEQQRSHNAQLLLKLQHMKGNIQVCCRVRPPTDAELSQNAQVVVEALGDTEVGYYDHRSLSWRSFVFDKVWGPDQSQQDIFCDVEPLALSVVDGYNACILAYGQTGSGKTHTMIGYHPQYGVSVRTLHKIFDLLQYRQSQAEQQQARIKLFADEDDSDNTQSSGGTMGTASDPKPRHTRTKSSLKLRGASSGNLVSRVNDDETKEPNPNPDPDPTDDEKDSVVEPDPEPDEKEIKAFEFSIRVSMLEIYNDEVRDLLNPSNTDLDIRQTIDGYVQVPGLERECVYSIGDVMRIFESGNANRAVAATNVHAHSSRSHSILVVDVDTSINSAPPVTGRLCLVDLAGSEKVSKSLVTGAELKEAQHINKSLSALGDVMEALDSKAKHIPYRNSKLTYLLQDSLGGNSHTLMIVTVCPTSATAEETSFTLQFATRVRRIQLGSATRNVNTKNLEETLKQAKNALKLSQRQKIKLEEELTAFKRELKRNQQKMASQMDARTRSNDDQKKTLELQTVTLRESKAELEQRLMEEKRKSDKVNEQLDATSKKLQRQEEQTKTLSKERDLILERLRESEKEIRTLRHQIHGNAPASRTKRTPTAPSTVNTVATANSNSVKTVESPPPAGQALKGRLSTPPRKSAGSGELGSSVKGPPKSSRNPSPSRNDKAQPDHKRTQTPTDTNTQDQICVQTHARDQPASRMPRPKSSTRLAGEEKPAHPKFTRHSRGMSHDSLELSVSVSSLPIAPKSRPASPLNPNPSANPSPSLQISSNIGPERGIAAMQKHRERLKKVREQK